MKKILFCIGLIVMGKSGLCAQTSPTINPDLLSKDWNAHWITHPDISGQEVGVYLFRKSFDLGKVPVSFPIHVSADNRYKLYVNGAMVCFGPSRGDLLKWLFETIDIAAYLKPGPNSLCAVVWNHADLRPVAHISAKTGLIVQGDTKSERLIDTDASWKVMKDEAYSLLPVDHLEAFYVAGPGESFDSRKHPWDWLAPGMNDADWKNALEEDKGMVATCIRNYGDLPPRLLVPRQIPMMEMTEQAFSRVRQISGIDNADAILLDGQDLTIPPQSKVIILLDQGQLTTAYPVVRFSNGKDSLIRLTYAEALHTPKQSPEVLEDGDNKGNRNEIEGKKIHGNYDVIVADGGSNRRVEPLWWRTFRYVQVEISTQDQALVLHQANSIFTGYPLVEKAGFKSDNPLFSEIWKVGWHTQRLCAGENFYDCPYYEQLQYAGDTRIQALLTYYVSGDTALWKKAIASFHDSRLPLGLTQSRYPSYKPQIIPTFSLVWITMLHDYLRHCDDAAFIEPMLPAITEILQWFETRLDDQGLPGHLEFWNFVDWVNHKNWNAGIPPQDREGKSSIIALQYVYTLERAAAIYQTFGKSEQAGHCLAMAARTKKAVLDTCWDETRRMVADTPSKQNFSQHANVLAVLVDLLPVDRQQDLVTRIIAEQDIAQCSYYFQFYLAESLKKANLAERYTGMLEPWQNMLNLGLTTFAEKSDPTRSDCHAWSSSPLYHFLALVCGIEPGTPGFKTVHIKPALGTLTTIDAHMPHPRGEIVLKLNQTQQGGLEGAVVLPQGLDGDFEFEGQMIHMNPGKTIIRTKPSSTNHD